MSGDAGVRSEDEESSWTMAVKFQVRGREGSSRWDDGVYSGVKRLQISVDSTRISCVRIEYMDKNGKLILGCQHGKHDVSTDATYKVELDYPTEYLTSIHGCYNNHSIKSLTFQTNIKTWGPYGCEEEEEEITNFSFPITEGKIVGFHGSTNSYSLAAIGVYVQPITKSNMPQPELELEPQPQLLEHFSLGQYGSEDGESWVETFRTIKRLLIHSDEQWMISIQMEYEDKNGKLVLSEKHGGDGGTLSEVVLAYPDEYLVTIQGHYDNSLDQESATNRILSLIFKTNTNTHGPFGVQRGTKFSFPTNDRLKIVGIHGKSSSYLNAIGLNVTTHAF